MIFSIRLTLVAAILFVAASSSLAQEGRHFALKAEAATFSYQTLSARGEMTLYRGGKAIGQRSLFVQQIEQSPGRYDLALLQLEAPNSLAGTKLLSWSNDTGDDRQWLTPGNSDRARRIGDRGRRANFVNSDYIFEDLLRWQVNSYRYSVVGPAKCPAGKCTRVQAIPTVRSSAYGAMLIDYDSKGLISQVQYFRKPGSTVWKTQVLSAYKRVGKTWQPTMTTMVDHSAGTETRIQWKDYVANAAMDAGLFRAK